jgi:NADPH:quinone reductase-like Zn-dependent oxidoreductase
MRSLRLDRQRQLIFRIRLGSVYLVSRKAANAGNHLSPLRLTRCSQCEELDKPVPAPGEVLIQVRAALVNPYDWHFLRGAPSFIRLFTGLRRPKSPSLGADVAGVAIAVGPGVTRFKPGDGLFGICKGAFAEFACGKETELAHKPERCALNKRLWPRSRASRLCRGCGTVAVCSSDNAFSSGQRVVSARLPYRLVNYRAVPDAMTA